MVIHVEFYGIPRSRAGVPNAQCELSESQTTLADIIRDLERRFPEFGSDCTNDGQLADSVVVNLAGDRFVRDVTTKIRDGQTVLIMSADAGG